MSRGPGVRAAVSQGRRLHRAWTAALFARKRTPDQAGRPARKGTWGQKGPKRLGSRAVWQGLREFGLGAQSGKREIGTKVGGEMAKTHGFAHRNTFRVFAVSECRPLPLGAALRGDRQVQFQSPRRNARPSKGPTRRYVFLLPLPLPTYAPPSPPPIPLRSTCLTYALTLLLILTGNCWRQAGEHRAPHSGVSPSSYMSPDVHCTSSPNVHSLRPPSTASVSRSSRPPPARLRPQATPTHGEPAATTRLQQRSRLHG